MKTLACFLEEPSAQAFLEGVLPRVLPGGITVQYVVFEGKQDLEKQLARKLRHWQKPNTVFLIMRDQDAEDCRKLKKRLSELCAAAGKPEALVRVACHELESFYFGDLSAVEKAMDATGIASQQQKSKYRNPDTIVNPAKELLKLTKSKYQKIGSSRAIGKIISLERNRSRSFMVLLSGIRKTYKIVNPGECDYEQS